MGVDHIDLSEQDRLFIEDEIWAVIKDMPSDKAPGPDGLHAVFYKRFWHILGDTNEESTSGMESHKYCVNTRGR